MRVARDLVPALPRAAWTLLGGTWLSALGTGLTLPFLLVYLHQVRGLELEVAALAVSTLAVAGLVGNPLGGWLADRLGPRNAVAAGLVIAAAGAFAVAAVREPWHAFAAAAVVGLGAAIVWPAQDALLATVVRPAAALERVRRAPRAAQPRVRRRRRLVAAVARAGVVAEQSFELVYVLDGVSFLAFVPILLLTPALRRTA